MDPHGEPRRDPDLDFQLLPPHHGSALYPASFLGSLAHRAPCATPAACLLPCTASELVIARRPSFQPRLS
uniref:Uncharacterized protein n=1 Tax=Triticum urartu TaxID=4572 RepID=A0A8R7Q5W7_TRIUA